MTDLKAFQTRKVRQNEFRIVVLCVLFLVFIWLADTVLDSFFSHRTFRESLVFEDMPSFFRALIVAGSFLAFGLVVAKSFAAERRIEDVLAERSDRLSQANRLLNEEIKERSQLETELRRSEERFRYIYENSPAMMHSIDRNGIVRNVNNKWLEGLSYTTEEVLGRDIADFMTAESTNRAISEILPKFWSEGKVKDVPYQYSHERWEHNRRPVGFRRHERSHMGGHKRLDGPRRHNAQEGRRRDETDEGTSRFDNTESADSDIY